jgi:hypothetical protein
MAFSCSLRVNRGSFAGSWLACRSHDKQQPGVAFVWQARRESNPQPPVLETGALPIELLAFVRSDEISDCRFQSSDGE